MVEKSVNKTQQEKKQIEEEKEISIEDIKWVPQMSVNEPTIDKQHKQILDQIRIMDEKADVDNLLPSVRECISFLNKYIKEHLAYEEKYMKNNNYPNLNEHNKIHQGFRDYYEKFNEELSVRLAKEFNVKKLVKDYFKKSQKFLANWWVNHINVVDQKYADFISGKGKKEIKKPKKNKEKEEIVEKFFLKEPKKVVEEKPEVKPKVIKQKKKANYF